MSDSRLGYGSIWRRRRCKSVVLLVLLLIYTAYVLYGERKIWAAVQLRRGPNVVGPWGLFQSFADLLQIRGQGADHPGRRQQGRLSARAAGDRHSRRFPPGP